MATGHSGIASDDPYVAVAGNNLTGLGCWFTSDHVIPPIYTTSSGSSGFAGGPIMVIGMAAGASAG